MSHLHETGWAVSEAISREVEARPIVLSAESEEILSSSMSEGMRYGEIRRINVPIESLSGRSTRKWFHAVVERMESGRYELVSYVL